MPPAPVLRTLQLPQPAPLHARPRVAERHVDRRSTACRPALSSVAVSMAEPVLSPTTDAEPQRHKVAIFVEPSPFSHVSGMKNRFECLIQGLRAAGDDVMVFTPDRNPPRKYHGAKVVSVLGFRLPFYKTPTLLLSLGLSVRVLWYLILSRPDVIHASSPGPMVFASILYAKLLAIPLVVSYHTHIPEYIPRYTWKGLVGPMWGLIRFAARMADLTLVTSKVMKDELLKNRCPPKTLDVWRKGVDTNMFHPRHRSAAMRQRLSGGLPASPILVHVGRLGAEKNLYVLRDILERIPGARLAFVGDGPERESLERHFAGTRTVFMGMVQGEELLQAYASADVFMMPSESETLGFVVLEAMASALPVVAVAAGGLTDILTEPGETGFLYPPGDYQTAVALTKQLVRDRALRERVGGAARLEVERWGWTASTRHLREQQYRTAINSYRRKHLWRPLREIIALLLQKVLAVVEVLFNQTVYQLDYARSYRTCEDA